MLAIGCGNSNDTKALAHNQPNTDATWRQHMMKFVSTRAGAKQLFEDEVIEHLEQEEAVALGHDHHTHFVDDWWP